MVATIHVVAGVMFLLLGLERVAALRRRRLRVFRDRFWSDVALLLLGFVGTTKLAMVYIAGAGDALDAFGAPRLASSGAPLWLMVVVTLVLVDLGNYVAHLLLHRFDALWELHKVHHSSRVLDWLATFRAHLVESVLRRLVAPVALILIGVPLAAVGIASAIFTAWATLNHSNLGVDLRALEPIFITPRLHHLHHVPATGARNLGTVLSLWDRALGRLVTRQVPADEPLGVVGEVETYPQGFVPQLREPFVRITRSAATVTATRS